MPPRRSASEYYSPASYLLYEYRITAKEVGDHQDPPRSRQAVGFELSGRVPLTEGTLDAILSLSGGNVELVNQITLRAREAFIERNPHRPERHAFAPKKVTT